MALTPPPDHPSTTPIRIISERVFPVDRPLVERRHGRVNVRVIVHL
jgi:hypothetical protein